MNTETRQVTNKPTTLYNSPLCFKGRSLDLDETFLQLSNGLSSSFFKEALARELTKNTHQKFIAVIFDRAKTKEGIQLLCSELETVATQVLKNAHESYRKQQEAQKLTETSINLDGIFEPKKTSRRVFTKFVNEGFSCEEHLKAKLSEVFRNAVKKSLALVILLEGEQEKTRSTTARQIANLKSLGTLDFFPKSGRAIERFAKNNAEVPLSQMRRFLLEIEAMPQIPVIFSLKKDQQNKRTLRFQMALATLPKRKKLTEISAEVSETVEIFTKLFKKDAGIEYYTFFSSNDELLIDTIFDAITQRKITLSSASCPDYSGSIETDSTGRQVFKYDFQKLGSDIGKSAKGGLPFVAHILDVLKEHNIEACYRHFEGTYEVANGFRTKTEDLTYTEAIRRLKASGLKVQKIMNDDYGIKIDSKLTSDVIDDERFQNLKAKIIKKLSVRSRKDNSFASYLRKLYETRAVLYHEWFPPTETEGTTESEKYKTRMIESIIPNQIAEYHLLARIMLAGRERKPRLLLAYDSPIMWESQSDLPVLFGQKAKELAYMGAL